MHTMKSRLVVALTALAMVAALDSRLQAADRTGREIYRYTLNGTALIIVPMKDGTATGTGWVVDLKNKLIVTNHHVVEENPRIFVLFPLFDKEGSVRSDRADYKEQDGYRAKLIHFDKKKDLALIQVTDRLPDEVKELKVAGRSPDPGERVHAVGNPGASGALWVYTSGSVRA
ncbi:MAG: serine protease, partial [Gemmataceae bacterium]